MPVGVMITENPDDDKNPVIQALADSAVILSSQPAAISNLHLADAVGNQDARDKNAIVNQQMVGQLAISIAGKAIQRIQSNDPLTAQSVQEVLTGSTVAASIAGLKSSIDHHHHPGERWIIPNPIPAGQTVYAEAPLYLSYDNENGTENFRYEIQRMRER